MTAIVSSIAPCLRLLAALVLLTAAPAFVTAAAAQTPAPGRDRVASALGFFGGAAIALAAHESGHLVFDVAFDANPGIRGVDFHGIPFFAITHDPLSPRREQVVSSAGFWVQHAISEWILTRRPDLRHESAPLAKGMLAFNIGASTAYAAAAFARTGPLERDTRGMADSARIDERWIGAIVLAPAVLDAWRYFDPDRRWLVWASRAAKAGSLLLVVR